LTLHARLTAAIDPARQVIAENDMAVGETIENLRAAAVLIPITDRPDPGVILTQRPDFLRSHAGQVAFPGGKVDEADADEIAAALREADEELAISPHHVNVIGITDIYYARSGFRITPVVGIIPPDLDLKPNPEEVEDWFEVPLSFLMDPKNAVQKTGIWMGQERVYYDIDWQGRRIWGVTAGIITNLIRRLTWDETK
jgi:8-oxo-dGTP pyrophosphatase MutT (NUDIX family)